MSTQRVRLNLSPDGRYVAVTASQYDVGGQFEIALYDGADEYEIPSGAGVVLSGTNPNGNTFLYNYGSPYVSVSGNIVTVKTTKVMTTAAGNVNCEIRIEQDGSSIGSANFFIWVEEKVFPMDEAVTENEHATILQAVNYLSQHTGEAAAAAERAEAAAAAVEDYSDMAKSWAVGPSGEGSYGTDTNNAKYWAEQTATDVQKVIDYATEVETNTQEVAANTQTVADNTAQTDINARAASNSAAAAAASAKRAEDAADILTGGTLVATAQGDINPIDEVHDDSHTPLAGVLNAPVDGNEYYPYTRASLVYMNDDTTVEQMPRFNKRTFTGQTDFCNYVSVKMKNSTHETVIIPAEVVNKLTYGEVSGVSAVGELYKTGSDSARFLMYTSNTTWTGTFTIYLSVAIQNVYSHVIENILYNISTKAELDAILAGTDTMDISDILINNGKTGYFRIDSDAMSEIIDGYSGYDGFMTVDYVATSGDDRIYTVELKTSSGIYLGTITSTEGASSTYNLNNIASGVKEYFHSSIKADKTEGIDVHNGYDHLTPIVTTTAPFSGYAYISETISFSKNNSGDRHGEIRINGTTVMETTARAVTTRNVLSRVNASVALPVNANDTIEFSAWHTAGSGVTLQAGGEFHIVFESGG